MDSKTYRASLLTGEVLAVSIDGDCEDEFNEHRPTTLRVGAAVDGRISTTEFFGTSLAEVVNAAATALGFDSFTLSDPRGNVTHTRIAIEADDDAITFRAKFAGQQLWLYAHVDDDEDDDSYMRLLAIEHPEGKRDLFRGKNLYDCLAAAKRFLSIGAIHFTKGKRDGRGRAVDSEAQKHAGWG